MAIGNSGSFTLELKPYSYGQFGIATLRFYWEEEYDAVANTSVIKITSVDLRHNKYSGGYDVDLKISANGTQFTKQSSLSVDLTSTGSYKNVAEFTEAQSAPILHDASTGELTVSLSVYAKVYGGNGGFSSYDTKSYSLAMTTIPRLSELTAVGVELGTEQTLTVAQKSADYTHSVGWSCGDASGSICEKSEVLSFQWTAPVALAAENTAGETVGVSFTTTTYSGDTAIGSSEKVITCSIPQSIKPVVSDGWAVAAPYNEGTKAESIAAYVQGYSKARVSFDSSKIDMSGTYGAAIASYEVLHNGAGVTDYTTAVLTAAGIHNLTCRVYDTRGRLAELVIPITVEAYAMPTLSDISVYRSDSAGTEDDEGVYISVLAKANISSIAGLNTVLLQARYGLTAESMGDYTTLASQVRQQIGGGTVLNTLTYLMELRLTDGLGNTAVYTQIIPTADVMFHARDGGRGAAFGKYSEADDLLEVAWNLKTKKNMTVEGDIFIGGQSLITILQGLGISIAVQASDEEE